MSKTNCLNFAQICNGNPAAESHVHWVSRNAALTFLPSAQSLFVISGAFFLQCQDPKLKKKNNIFFKNNKNWMKILKGPFSCGHRAFRGKIHDFSVNGIKINKKKKSSNTDSGVSDTLNE